MPAQQLPPGRAEPRLSRARVCVIKSLAIHPYLYLLPYLYLHTLPTYLPSLHVLLVPYHTCLNRPEAITNHQTTILAAGTTNHSTCPPHLCAERPR